MKDHSLFHLLMARLRQLSGGLPADQRVFAEGLQGNLKVEQDGEWFLISWRWRNKEFDLNVPGDAFRFYVRGDTGGPPATRGGRMENWQQAESVLRRIAEISGESLPLDRRPGSLSIFVFDQDGEETWQAASRRAALVISGLLAGLVALAFRPAEIAVWTAVAATALSYLNDFLRPSFLRRPSLHDEPMRWLEPVVISAGTLVPAGFAAAPIGPALIAVALSLFARAELRGAAASALDWGAAGAVAGACVLALGPQGWVPVALIVLLILMICVLLPNRVRAVPALAAAAATLVMALIAAWHGPLSAAHGVPPPPVASSLAWAVTGILAVLFLLGWVLGQQFLLFPWAGCGIVSATCLTLLLGGAASGAASAFTAFLGFGICGIVRLLYAFRLVRRRVG